MVNIAKDPRTGLNAAVAAELRAARAAQGVTISALAKRSELSENTVGRLLNTERLITIEALVEIADALGVSVTDIMARAEDRLDWGGLPWRTPAGA